MPEPTKGRRQSPGMPPLLDSAADRATALQTFAAAIVTQHGPAVALALASWLEEAVADHAEMAP